MEALHRYLAAISTTSVSLSALRRLPTDDRMSNDEFGCETRLKGAMRALYFSHTPQWYGQNPLSLPLSSLDCQPSRMRSRKRSMLECVSMVHCCHDSGCPVNGHRPFSASTACTEDQSPTQTPDMTFRLCATAILRETTFGSSLYFLDVKAALRNHMGT